MLSLSKVGYKDGTISGLSCDVDVDVDVDVVRDEDVEFVELKGTFLQIAGTEKHSFSVQSIVSKTSVDIELRN